MNVKIGDKYFRVLDRGFYEVVREDSLCFYLCVFDGSCSKITSVSKKMCIATGKFNLLFVPTRDDLLKRNVENAKMDLASAEATLRRQEERG